MHNPLLNQSKKAVHPEEPQQNALSLTCIKHIATVDSRLFGITDFAASPSFHNSDEIIQNWDEDQQPLSSIFPHPYTQQPHPSVCFPLF